MGAHEVLGVFHTKDTLITAGSGEYSANFIDLGVISPKKPRIGIGQHTPFLCIRTAIDPTQLADSLSIELRASAQNDTTDLSGTPVTVMMPLADIAGNAGKGVNEVLCSDTRLATAGAWVYRGQLPYGINLRYLQLFFNQATHTGNIALDAWLSDGPPTDFRGSQVVKSNVGQP